MKFLKENWHNEDDIELYYDDLEITIYGGKMDWDTGCYEEKEVYTDWTYYADRTDVEDFLMKYAPEEIQNSTDDDVIKKYFDENIESMVEEHMQELLDYFEDQAKEDAEEHNDIDFDEYDYDPDAEYDAWRDEHLGDDGE